MTFSIKAGEENGLEVVLKENHSDAFFHTLRLDGYQILIFRRNEYPDALTGNYRKDFTEASAMISIDIKPIVFQADPDIARFDPNSVIPKVSIYFLLT